MPHGVDWGVTFVENNEEGRGGDTLCQTLTVQIFTEETNKIKLIQTEIIIKLTFIHVKWKKKSQFLLSVVWVFSRDDCLIFAHLFNSMSNVLCVQFHPVLQLLGDVLVPPLSQVGDDDPRVKGACVGPHPQLLDSLLLEVQETYIIILLKKIWILITLVMHNNRLFYITE